MFAEMKDRLGGTVEYWRAHDGSREVGKVKPYTGMWIDLLRNPSALEIVTPVARGRK
jgi:2-oxoglutarate dehydrogenase complex dehydrogenase (E1) component-like enzyme